MELNSSLQEKDEARQIQTVSCWTRCKAYSKYHSQQILAKNNPKIREQVDAYLSSVLLLVLILDSPKIRNAYIA